MNPGQALSSYNNAVTASIIEWVVLHRMVTYQQQPFDAAN
jgi:hypothetical protein